MDCAGEPMFNPIYQHIRLMADVGIDWGPTAAGIPLTNTRRWSVCRSLILKKTCLCVCVCAHFSVWSIDWRMFRIICMTCIACIKRTKKIVMIRPYLEQLELFAKQNLWIDCAQEKAISSIHRPDKGGGSQWSWTKATTTKIREEKSAKSHLPAGMRDFAEFLSAVTPMPKCMSECACAGNGYAQRGWYRRTDEYKYKYIELDHNWLKWGEGICAICGGSHRKSIFCGGCLDETIQFWPGYARTARRNFVYFRSHFPTKLKWNSSHFAPLTCGVGPTHLDLSVLGKLLRASLTISNLHWIDDS